MDRFRREMKSWGFEMELIHGHDGAGYGSHIVDSGSQMKYKITKGQVQISLDIRSDCGLTDQGADFDINCFVLRRKCEFIETDGCQVRTSLQVVIRHLTWSASNTKRYFTKWLEPEEYRRELIKVRAKIVKNFEATYHRCKAGQFTLASGYCAEPSLYTERLRKMTSYGYVCIWQTVLPRGQKSSTKAFANFTSTRCHASRNQTLTEVY